MLGEFFQICIRHHFEARKECFYIFYRQSHFQYFVKTLLDKVTIRSSQFIEIAYGANQQEQDTKTIFIAEKH
jgi:hypothetical protein